MKRTPWVPLDANFQDDRRIVDVSVAAELVYLRSLGLTKRLDDDAGNCWLSPGHLRKLCDKLDLGEAGRRAVAAELVDVGAWSYNREADTWMVTAWASWNVSLSEASERKRDGARMGNHRRYGHKGDLASCQICQKPEPAPVSPGGSLVAKRPDTDRFASRSSSLDVDVDVDVENTTPLPPSADPSDVEAEARAVAVADSLLPMIGYFERRAGIDLVRYVERALARGKTIQEMEDKAAEVAAMSPDEIETTPLRVLVGAIKKLANQPKSDQPSALARQPGSTPAQGETRDAAWAAVARIASLDGAGTLWLDRMDLSPRTRQAAHDARLSIKNNRADKAMWDFYAAYAAAAAPVPA